MMEVIQPQQPQHLDSVAGNQETAAGESIMSASATSSTSEGTSYKQLYFIRHGQSEYNAAFFQRNSKRNWDPESPYLQQQQQQQTPNLETLFDPSLTEIGRKQTEELKDKLKEIEKIEMVVTSPLFVSLQTTQLAFDHSIPVVVSSLHTEQVAAAANIGRSPQELAQLFPSWNFDSLQSQWWYNTANNINNNPNTVTADNTTTATSTPSSSSSGSEGDNNTAAGDAEQNERWKKYSNPNAPNQFIGKEPYECVVNRIDKFREWLLGRPENVIAIIGHSNFFLQMTGLKRRPKHCEIIPLRLSTIDKALMVQMPPSMSGGNGSMMQNHRGGYMHHGYNNSGNRPYSNDRGNNKTRGMMSGGYKRGTGRNMMGNPDMVMSYQPSDYQSGPMHPSHYAYYNRDPYANNFQGNRFPYYQPHPSYYLPQHMQHVPHQHNNGNMQQPLDDIQQAQHHQQQYHQPHHHYNNNMRGERSQQTSYAPASPTHSAGSSPSPASPSSQSGNESETNTGIPIDMGSWPTLEETSKANVGDSSGSSVNSTVGAPVPQPGTANNNTKQTNTTNSNTNSINNINNTNNVQQQSPTVPDNRKGKKKGPNWVPLPINSTQGSANNNSGNHHHNNNNNGTNTNMNNHTGYQQRSDGMRKPRDPQTSPQAQADASINSSDVNDQANNHSGRSYGRPYNSNPNYRGRGGRQNYNGRDKSWNNNASSSPQRSQTSPYYYPQDFDPSIVYTSEGFSSPSSPSSMPPASSQPDQQQMSGYYLDVGHNYAMTGDGYYPANPQMRYHHSHQNHQQNFNAPASSVASFPGNSPPQQQMNDVFNNGANNNQANLMPYLIYPNPYDMSHQNMASPYAHHHANYHHAGGMYPQPGYGPTYHNQMMSSPQAGYQPHHAGGYRPSVNQPAPGIPQVDPETLRDLVLKQIEYYFGNENLSKDSYLQNHMDGNGWVPLGLVSNFKRLKKLATDVSFLTDVIRTNSSLIELNPEGTKIRRKGDWANFIGIVSSSSNPQLSPSSSLTSSADGDELRKAAEVAGSTKNHTAAVHSITDQLQTLSVAPTTSVKSD